MTATAIPAPHVRYVELNGAVVILDLSIGEYLSLRPPASDLWMALVGKNDVDKLEDALLAGFREEMIRRRYFVPEVAETSKPLSPRRVYRATTLNAIGAILAVDRHLRRRSFGRLYGALQREKGTGADPCHLKKALRCFLRAEGLLAYRSHKDDCLRRSLALFAFCTGTGLDVQHNIGVRDNPFQAHAWTSHDGVPLLDSSAKIAGFKPIAVL